MSDITSLTDSILNHCKELTLQVESASDGNFRLFTDQATGITIFFNIKGPNDFSYYFLVRTYDVVFQGDKTDVHVILSLIFASFLRNFETNISSSLFDIAHPVVDDEVWGRYIVPEQNAKRLNIKSWSDLESFIVEILTAVAFWRNIFWQSVGCPCKECLSRIGFEDNYRGYDLSEEIDHSKNNKLKFSNRLNSGSRIIPKWEYFYDIENEITIIKSQEIADFFQVVLKSRIAEEEKLNGLNGEFIVSKELKNFISKSIKSEFKKYFNNLELNIPSNKLEYLPLENMILSVSSPYLIALGRLTGEYKFKVEKEKIRQRHNKESEFLFPIPDFDWNDSICPDQFEDLIKVLLELENSVKSVKKNSPTNQGDKGRDLLIDWNVIKDEFISKAIPPIRRIKVVGQCKASSSTVGKSKVQDIRDTVETHNAEGFFLAVSSQITAPLTEKLEDLKSKGIWTEWWNKDDIEIRLSKNPELIPLFPKVLKAKKVVKFYEKDI
jgi:hypothetical protein